MLQTHHNILISIPQALLNNRITRSEKLLPVYLPLIVIKVNIIAYWSRILQQEIGEVLSFKLLVLIL